MSRQKLIKQLKDKNPNLDLSQIKFILDEFSKNVSNAFIEGKSVEIKGLGHWYLKKLKENFNARNPATNKLIYKPERIKIRFRASKNLNKIINE